MSFNMYLKSKNANTNSEKLVFLQTDKIDKKIKKREIFIEEFSKKNKDLQFT